MPRCSALILVGLSLALGACRADEEQCRELAQHIVEIAEAEGASGTIGTADSLERDCTAVRPTKRLVDCMLKAQSRAEIEAC